MNNLEQSKSGRIIEVRKNTFIIDSEGQEVSAVLRGGFYEETPDALPVVGDYVTFLHYPAGVSVIQSVEARRNLLRRPKQSKQGGMQAMAANVDYCFIVTSLNGNYNYNRIARYASVALQGGAAPVAILTKADLCEDAGAYLREVETISDKIRVHAVSALLGTGMEELKEYFAPGKTICLMGSSGVGKSTLINAIAGEEIMKTGEIRQSDDKGRHTTTHRQLIKLGAASVIDTPGMREIGIASAGDGLDDTFSDILELASRCKFANCRHLSEPGCAVKDAIARGELSRERLKLYQRLNEENAGYAARKKEISKLAKAYQKSKSFRRQT
ncbi:MAG: ribosome small subunit-dependent GTPase A [Oscillospiraceae bacterium]|nr:ribosome small subunit-dependent GTPase A [Oscillospiraceae bacterium]